MDTLTRRTFLHAGLGTAASLGGLAAVPATTRRAEEGRDMPAAGRLILNDDGHVFLNLSDDLHKDDLRRYLQSYSRPGLDAVAYCVGDMTWPTLYPTQVGNQRGNSTPAASDQVRALLTLLPYLEYEIALKAD